MLNDIKKILGINNNNFDTILQTYIQASKQDLLQAGIIQTKIVETDALIYSAIVSYVCSMVDTFEQREMYAQNYAIQKDQLRHYGNYLQ